MDYNNKPETYYKFPRPEMLEFLPKEAQCVLDVGCGQGTFGGQIKNLNNAEVWGIEYMPNEGEMAKSILDKVFIGAVEDFLTDLPNNYFDVIYFNDVLEHLAYPDQVLKDLKPKLKSKGLIISSIPNMRYFRSFKKLVVNGDWDYQDHGVMDKTHLRWFTKKSIRKMYESIGFKILQHQGINPSGSIKPLLYNIPFCFTALDIKYKQFATVAQKIDLQK
ncbi:class I SAM-dependent methyltransferase [Subsaximicrobium wynnwilliamsii]|uniref:Class I SAM-dependent methyltransferase n=1 Tax=Subsaximicrobium wynnwilliamsii TaxID=291179 RepID=A0A5C6ZNQ5_9FLAO|nr:class I SAM-dependent methyltransferase [Subsaximicrobium wynnwilliamsii]TXD84962.1 class I SAM-dependent methyltransferase [Subsaximicrobium wynnwilliamsii]TXD90633.1 class I SAM-dependent methyltransferase [Subsaximicrobium wynnwilliamsii]TXE05107.1 class I SAM-dependent methyltransferase [Subsaximicrobium wynnwilliamsii]